MIAELEMIGQRMGERLLASRLLSTVEIELQEKSFVLTFSPIPTLTISQRIMRFCMNFFGELKPPPRHHELFTWCAAFAEFPDDRTCRVWVACDFYTGYAGFDVLSELLLLGLKLSSKLPSPVESNGYRLEDLVQVYRTKEEVLTVYEHFVAQVIGAGDDLPTNECEPLLRTRWTCCPKHRFLFVQRLMLNDWLHHIFDVWDPDEEYEVLPEMDYLVDHPSVEEMQQSLADFLAKTFPPQEWLRARFAYAVQVEREHWDRPIKHLCQRKHHISLACCSFHTAMMAIWYLFSTWLEHYNDIYHMSEMRDEQGYPSGLSSANGIAFLIRLANLDTCDIAFTGWFKGVPSIDVSKFHLQQDGDNPR